MYSTCASKGPKVGGDYAQETIDIAVPFFVDALKWNQKKIIRKVIQWLKSCEVLSIIKERLKKLSAGTSRVR